MSDKPNPRDKLKGLLTRPQVAKYLGVHTSTVTRMVKEGSLRPEMQFVGRYYLYDIKEVDAVKKRLYPVGLTYQQIATLYKVARNTVKRNFKRYGLKPLGWQYRTQTPVFDPDKVDVVALSLGWLRSPTSAASSQDDAT